MLVPATLILALSVGVVRASFIDTLFMAISHLFGPSPGIREEVVAWAVVWDLRLPRALMALLAGTALALAGAALQGALRNPLVSPFTLGISSGASFGAALAIVLGVGLTGTGAYMVMANAFLFSLVAAVLALGIARLKGMTRESIILGGIAIMYLFSALITLLQYVAHEWDLKALVYWIMGDLALANWRRVSISLLSLLACIPLFKYAWDLNVLAMGDEIAKTSGTDPGVTRLICALLAAFATAAVVCVTGPIGFIGLVSPHMARLLIGSDHRFSMPCSAILGMLILLAADTVARVLFAPFELPVGVITAFLGVPLFLSLLLRARRETWR